MEEEMGVVECGSPTLSGTRGKPLFEKQFSLYLISPTLLCMVQDKQTALLIITSHYHLRQPLLLFLTSDTF